ncbi:MAG: glycosyltransferase family 4 protein, partial [bacterium]|nr:glycosyltransferase family 4 protein [bacterium]
RIADAYVMPSRGEGFGIVYLEAMACGIPTVGSKLDGSRDALRNGQLGLLADPTNLNEVQEAILQALNKPKGIPEGLDYFSVGAYRTRTHDLLKYLLASREKYNE